MPLKNKTKKIFDIGSSAGEKSGSFVIDLKKQQQDLKKLARVRASRHIKRSEKIVRKKNKNLKAVTNELVPTRDEILRELKELELSEQKREEGFLRDTNWQDELVVTLSGLEDESYKNDEIKSSTESIKKDFVIDKKEKETKIKRAKKQKEIRFTDIITKNKKPVTTKALKRSLKIFVIFSLVFSLVIPGFVFYQKAQGFKHEVFNLTAEAIGHLKSATKYVQDSNLELAVGEFKNAEEKFSQGSSVLDGLGASVFSFFDKVPGVALVSVGDHLLNTGKYLTEAAQELTITADYFLSNDFGIYSQLDESSQNISSGDGSNTLVDTIIASQEHLQIARSKVAIAKMELNLINKSSLSGELETQISNFEEAVSEIFLMLDKTEKYSNTLLKILGNDYSKLYLFIFQNNQEIRATGGFIGTYGLFKVDNGKIDKVLVDGIYNPDGQLTQKIIPPFPLWKISPSWGLRDSNWFADFPTSAEKIVSFYEKTGGPTVDGVVALTPTVMERLLDIIGPIEMPEYDIVVTPKNFIEVTQREVELEYDKEQNRPKQFLTDLTPIVLGKIFNAPKEQLAPIFKTFGRNFKERHMMLYFLDDDLQSLVLEEKLGGALLDAPKDYLSVVNSNIDGRKTDGIINNEIKHFAEIQSDGSVVDTVFIKRIHKGGTTGYDWWNSENKNFLRVYVPKGSEFLAADGFIKEVPVPLMGVDYSEYQEDETLSKMNQTLKQDDKSGTWVFEENNKTVFGNWVYIAPGETSEVSFKYRLPFKVSMEQVGNYSILVQKQAGTIGDKFLTDISIPERFNTVWQYPESEIVNGGLKTETTLDTDKFFGIILSKD